MANTEFRSILRPNPDLDSQVVTISGTSAQSAATDGATRAVRLHATTDMFVVFGSNPTAVADGTHMFLPAGQTETFRVEGGAKIAGIQDSAGGSLYITEMVE